ncbi:MAG: BadF/BadG/BcrA/BcrD ATPase family protein [Butyricicoccaceae bacterium]
MAVLLDVTPSELDELAQGAERIYTIASRCGVFAKSDIQPLLNEGARKEDVAASIFQAVVNQTIAGLAQGREVKGDVLFLGGPLFFFKGLQKRFQETLGLDDEHAHFPALAPYAIAAGAAEYAGTTAKTYTVDPPARRRSKRPPAHRSLPTTCRRCSSPMQQYEEFKSRHSYARRHDPERYRLRGRRLSRHRLRLDHD